MPLPTELKNMTQGYGKRSLMWPRTIWPATADELKMERTTVAVKGEESVRVKLAMYKDTGKYENPCKRIVTDCQHVLSSSASISWEDSRHLRRSRTADS